MNTNNFTAATGAHLAIQLGGTTAGLGSNSDGTNGYDRLVVTGTVALGGADLQLSLINGFAGNLHIGDKFFILTNDGMDAVGGTFTEGSSISVGGDVFSINYADNGDGGTTANDVSLTVFAVPEPGTRTMLIGGFGLLFVMRFRKTHSSQTTCSIP